MLSLENSESSHRLSSLQLRLKIISRNKDVEVFGNSNQTRESKLILFLSVFRMIVCNQVMKFILDKIEKDEKQAAKKRKKEEVVEQKRSKQNATKLTALLYKHKEQLKAEILKKRALLDKELQLQVQVRSR